MEIHRYLNNVYCGDALDLLQTMPDRSVDSVITDAMYGVSKNCFYEWGYDPAMGDPEKHWQYHRPIYQECLRVLRPGGVLAWAQGVKFHQHFLDWFGPHRIWTLTRYGIHNKTASGHIWVVQTQDQRPMSFPDKDSIVLYDRLGRLKHRHPCIKTVEEMKWVVEALTRPGQIVLDCFCGLGATLLGAQQVGRPFIGCDISRLYCKITLRRLRAAALESQVAEIPEPAVVQLT